MGTGGFFEASLFAAPEAGGWADAEEDSDQAAEEAYGYERWPDEAQFEGLEAFLSGRDGGDD